MANEAFFPGTLRTSINQALIILISKNVAKDTIWGWGAITLLNVSYSILVKVLALWMHKVASRIVKQEHTRRKFILDTMIFAWEAMVWARETNQDSSFLKIDFDKACDRVNWSFITNMLQCYDFFSRCIAMVDTIFSNASAFVSVNKTHI
jgi:hypothetical protein